MDSDKKWFDVEFTIRGTMRTHGTSISDACERVKINLGMIQFNPGGFNDLEMTTDYEIELLSCRFAPQGYRTRNIE